MSANPELLLPSPTSIRTICLLLQGKPAQQVLLGYKKTGFGAGKYTGIGGKVEAGESVRQAAVRELYEETGVQAFPDELFHAAQLTFLFPGQPDWSQVDHVFLLYNWRGEPQEGREVRPEWFLTHELPYPEMWSDARFWLPIVLAGQRLSLRFIFASDNENIQEIFVETGQFDVDEPLSS
jgi:8-oxo-dGTP diphosphatase